MGNGCSSISCLTYGQSRSLTLNVEDLQESGNVTELEEQFDNPQHERLKSKFLETEIAVSNRLSNLEEKRSLKENSGQEKQKVEGSLKKQESEKKQKSLKELESYKKNKTLQVLKIKKYEDMLEIQPENKGNNTPFNMQELYLYCCKSLSVKSQKTVNFQDFITYRKDNIRDKYDFLQKIGQGAYGKVFKAHIRTTQEVRAIKMVRKNRFQAEVNEIKLLKECDHPNIIQLYEIFQEVNFYYVVTEYCGGGSVINFIKNNSSRFSQQIVKDIARQILSALVYIHNLKIIHRDIKLENMVFVEERRNDEDGQTNLNLKIIDFGGAFRMKYKINKEKRKVGTLSYMAPEAFDGIYSEKTDIWSCGVAIYVLMCGCLPFRGTNYERKKQAIKFSEASYKQRAWEKATALAKELIKKLLTKDYFKRPTASECLRDPWFAECPSLKKSQIRKASLKVTKSISKYYAGNNFISVIQSYISFLKVSQQEKNELKKLFQFLDKKNTGKIAVEDVVKACSLVDGEQDEEELRRIIQTLDKNHSGAIDFLQFQIAVYGKKKLFVETSLMEAFDHFDVDKSGYIEKKEFCELLEGCENLEITLLLYEIDVDKDSKISREEFLEYFRKFQKNLINEQ